MRRKSGLAPARLELAVTVGMIALWGCGSPAEQAVKSGEVHLTLAEFQLEDAQGKPLSMSAEGVVTGPQGLWGHIHPDGAVTAPDGALRGKLLKTGSVVDAKGTELATISEDGAAKLGPHELHFGEDGKLAGGEPGQTVQLHAANPGVRRTAMLVLIMAELAPLPK